MMMVKGSAESRPHQNAHTESQPAPQFDATTQLTHSADRPMHWSMQKIASGSWHANAFIQNASQSLVAIIGRLRHVPMLVFGLMS